MKLLQSNVLGGNKLLKAMQVLGGPTQILKWGSEMVKVLPGKLRGDLELWYQGET